MSAAAAHQQSEANQQSVINDTDDNLGGTNRPTTTNTDANVGSSEGTSRNNSPPRPFTTEDGRISSGGNDAHEITIYDSSRDGATAHMRPSGRVGGGGGNNLQHTQRPTSTGNNNNNVYSALDELRFEILDANSQAIYLTQCQDYVTSEQLLVTTFNRLVELEEQQVQQLEQLDTEQQTLAEDEESLIQRKAELEAEIRSGGADPTVEGGFSMGPHAQQLLRIQSEEADINNRKYHLAQIAEQHKYATQLNDLLKATTLNNIAFVIYHRGMFREALTHLETAQSLEGRYGIQSPAVAINLCVLQNAVENYDLATQYALLAIDMLRRTSSISSPKGSPRATSQQPQKQVGEGNGSQQHDGWRGQDPQEATGLAPTTFEEKKKLWGAAWHNLAVAQLQLADPKSEQQNSNVRLMFENSVAATIELLGREHPMTRAVVESFRIVRKALHERGAYKPQRQLVTGSEKGMPMLHTYFSEEALQQPNGNNNGPRYSAYTGKRIAPPSHRGAAIKEARQLSVILKTKENIKYVEKIDLDPYTQKSPADIASSSTGNAAPSSRALTTAGSNNMGYLASPRVAQQQRTAAMAREQALSSRKLSRGTPSSPTNNNGIDSGLPLIGSGRGKVGGGTAPQSTILTRHYQPPSVNNKNFFSGASGTNGPQSAGSRKNQMAQRALGGSMLQGNLALAVALYSNPHPLSSTITAPAAPNTPRGAGNQYRYTAAFGGLPGTPTSASNSPRGSKVPQRLPALPNNQHHQQQPILIPPPPQNQHQPQQLSSTSSNPGTFIPAPPQSSGGPRPPSSSQPFNRNSRGGQRASQQTQPAMAGMLIGDMWVEAPIAPPRAPFRTNSPMHSTDSAAKQSSPNEGSPAGSPSSQRGQGSVISSPASAKNTSSPYNSPPYPQQLLAPDQAQRVVDPSRYAHPAAVTPISETKDIVSVTPERERGMVEEQRRRSVVVDPVAVTNTVKET